MPLDMKFRIQKLGSKMLVQVYDRGKTPRSQRSAKGVLCMACGDEPNAAFKTVRQQWRSSSAHKRPSFIGN